jgi:spore coat polysaccharide biosynthesis protein SpsF (cytidylyltransferase family)
MELKKNVLAIIQARYNSTRFPGKVIQKIENKTILEILIQRLSKSKYISKIIVACSKNPKDKTILDICKKLGIETVDKDKNKAKSKKELYELIIKYF